MQLHDWITLTWLVGGLTLMGLELLIPGLVVVFMGAAAVLVSGLLWLGVISSPITSLAVWMALSVALVVALRSFFERYLPSESHRDDRDEMSVAVGHEVDVLVTCDEDSMNGRVRYQGTSWPAQTISGRIEAGTKARLVIRENLAWIIEPADATAAVIDTIERDLAAEAAAEVAQAQVQVQVQHRR